MRTVPYVDVLGWSKCLFGFFCNILGKTQTNILANPIVLMCLLGEVSSISSYSAILIFLPIIIIFFNVSGDLKNKTGTSLAVQWLRLCLPMRGTGSIPDRGAKIPHASGPKSQNRTEAML